MKTREDAWNFVSKVLLGLYIGLCINLNRITENSTRRIAQISITPIPSSAYSVDVACKARIVEANSESTKTCTTEVGSTNDESRVCNGSGGD